MAEAISMAVYDERTLLGVFDTDGVLPEDTPGEVMRLAYIGAIKEIRQDQLSGLRPLQRPTNTLDETKERITDTIAASKSDEAPVFMAALTISQATSRLLHKRMLRSVLKLSASGYLGTLDDPHVYWWDRVMEDISSPINVQDFKPVTYELLVPRLLRRLLPAYRRSN
jgi:hypothetical protein